MPTFPRTEVEIIALAQLVAEGLGRMAEDFPSPPISANDLQASITEYTVELNATIEADMASKARHAAKDKAFEATVDGVKRILKYAEATAKSPEKLEGLSWSRRRDKTPLKVPGEVRNIAMGNQGENWVVLSWNPPVEGGLTAAYQIQRKQANGAWEDAGVATETEYVVANQPRGVDLSYHVIAVNKAGRGQPSGVVTAVL